VTPDWFIVESRADDEVRDAYAWYQNERQGLGDDFLAELRAAYLRIIEGPRRYQATSTGVRRVQLRRFPYIVYFVIEGEVVIVFAVLHARRDPAIWQRRRG
jgi:plasmid stabilization system protein ParE